MSPRLKPCRELFGGAASWARQPDFEIGQSPRAQGALFGGTALLGFATTVRGLAARQRREQTEVDVHRLERAGTVRVGAEMPARDVAKQRTEGGGEGRRLPGHAPAFGRRRLAGKETDGGAFDVALAAGDLARKAQARADAEPKLSIEQLRRIEEGVAMEPAEAGKLRLGPPGIKRKIRTCSPCLSLVWKPTMFHKLPSALSCRSCTTA